MAIGRLVQELIAWRTEARKVLARWTSLVRRVRLGGTATPEWMLASRRSRTGKAAIEDVRLLTFEYDAKLHSRLAEVFGKATADRMWDSGETFVADGVRRACRPMSTRGAWPTL